MKHITNSIFVSLWLLISGAVIATNSGPSLNANCPFKIVRPKNGTEIRFNESCTEAYVLPPGAGTAEITSLARTTNLQFCSAVKNASRALENTFESMAILSDKIAKMIQDFDPLDKDIIELRGRFAQSTASRDQTKKRFEQAETQIREMREAEREAKQDYQDCLIDNEADPAKCIEQKSEWDELKRELDEFRRGEYRTIRNEAQNSEREYNQLSRQLNELSRRYIEAMAPIIELQNGLMDLNTRVSELYRDYVRLEGATGQITWTVQWDQLLEEYRRLNPTLNIRWSLIPIKEAQLISTVKIPMASSTIELESVSAIKSAVIPGAQTTGFSGMGNGGKVSGVQLEASPPTQASIIFGNGIGGQIVLTLLGACPYFDGIENRNKIDANELTRYMVANLIYSYELAARRGYSASYNLSNMLYKIEKKSKRGGFFSTEAAHSIAEKADSKDWFTISFEGNSSEFQYTKTEQEQLAVTVKKELMDKAMKQFAILNAGGSTPGSVPNFVESGAYRSSAELRKCPLVYCQVGSAILGVANSIWGRSTATASFHKNNNVWVSERISGIQFVNRSGSLTFDRNN